MNRRGLFGLLAAAVASPRAVRLAPARRVLTLQPGESYTTPWIKLTPPPLPLMPVGRLQAALDMFDDGQIDAKTLAEVIGA